MKGSERSTTKFTKMVRNILRRRTSPVVPISGSLHSSREDGFVFGYLEFEDTQGMKETMEESETQAQWSEQTLPLLKELPDNISMDKICRLVPSEET